MAAVFLLFVVPLFVYAVLQSPDTVGTVQSALIGEPNFRLRLHTPQEAVEDTLATLDSLLKLELAVQMADDEEYVNQLQRLLQTHKNRIRLVHRNKCSKLTSVAQGCCSGGHVTAYLYGTESSGRQCDICSGLALGMRSLLTAAISVYVRLLLHLIQWLNRSCRGSVLVRGS